LLVSGPAEPGEQTGLWVLPAMGGPLHKLAENAWCAAVSPDDRRIAFISSDCSEVWVMGSGGGQPRRLAKAEPGYTFTWVAWSPDSRRVAGLKRSKAGDEFQIESWLADTGQVSVILSDPRLRSFCWARDGRIVYARLEPPPSETSSNLWEIQTDARTGQARGTPRRLTNWGGFMFGYLGISADSRRLTFVRWRYQSDVYVGELERNATRLSNRRRLTLDERIDWPSGWMRDGQTLLFHSDRNGDLDIFRQPVTGGAQAVVTGPGEERGPRLSPDGAWILYLYWPRAEGRLGQGRLMRVPVAGGRPEFALNVRGYPGSAQTASEARLFIAAEGHPGFRCPAVPRLPCVLCEQDEKQLVFSAFDPREGGKRELFRIDSDPSVTSFWDLSPDGRRIAFGVREERRARVRILSLAGQLEREVAVQGWTHLEAVAWAVGGDALFMTGWTSNGAPLLHVALDGKAHLLRRAPFLIANPSPSPDGRHIAFGEVTPDANAWVIENFR